MLEITTEYDGMKYRHNPEALCDLVELDTDICFQCEFIGDSPGGCGGWVKVEEPKDVFAMPIEEVRAELKANNIDTSNILENVKKKLAEMHPIGYWECEEGCIKLEYIEIDIDRCTYHIGHDGRAHVCKWINHD